MRIFQKKLSTFIIIWYWNWCH